MSKKELSNMFPSDNEENNEEKPETNPMEEVRNRIDKKHKEKANRPTVDETHTRTTFLLRNDLSEELNDLASNYKRGFKTDFLNEVIAYGLQGYGRDVKDYEKRYN